MSQRHEIVSSTTPFTGGFFSVNVDEIRLPNGRVTKREYVKHPGAAAVVAVRGDEVLLVTQNRHAVGEDLLEIPAGKLDVEGETPAECASRELIEETGYRAGSLVPLGSFHSSPGFTDETFHLFLATGLESVAPPPADDDGEPLIISWLPMADAVAALSDGRIVDAKSAVGIALVRLRDAVQESPAP